MSLLLEDVRPVEEYQRLWEFGDGSTGQASVFRARVGTEKFAVLGDVIERGFLECPSDLIPSFATQRDSMVHPSSFQLLWSSQGCSFWRPMPPSSDYVVSSRSSSPSLTSHSLLETFCREEIILLMWDLLYAFTEALSSREVPPMSPIGRAYGPTSLQSLFHLLNSLCGALKRPISSLRTENQSHSVTITLWLNRPLKGPLSQFMPSEIQTLGLSVHPNCPLLHMLISMTHLTSDCFRKPSYFPQRCPKRKL